MKEIYSAIEAIGKYLGLDPLAVGILLVLPLGLIYWRFRYYQDVLKTPGGLAGTRESLAVQGSWRETYFGELRRALAWVDGKLGDSSWSADRAMNLRSHWHFSIRSPACLSCGSGPAKTPQASNRYCRKI